MRAQSPVRAAYASLVSHGRRVAEPPSPTRSPFQRDRDRIVHCTAFRRLAHKTQVFVPLAGDHFRTRLTHTIEVAQIARALARGLGLDDDLAEAIALSHDLGHTPFGHAGEDALDPLMAPYGGFDHNAQALRVVTALERRYAGFDGLNLTWDTLEGLVKHNGPLVGPDGAALAERGVPKPIRDFDASFPLGLALHAGAEAQAAALADDIAYNAHDIDDGLRAGLFGLDDLRGASPFLAGCLDDIAATHGALERGRVIHELVRRVITRFVEDALTTSADALERAGVTHVDAVRRAGRALVTLSPAMAATEREIKTFLFSAMYRHPTVMRFRARATTIISALFSFYLADKSHLPLEWGGHYAGARGAAGRARVVADFLAGMTDRFALSEYRRAIDPQMTLD